MSLTVTCPDCDKTLKVKDEVAGKKIRCPACSTVFSVSAKSNDSDDDFLSDLDEPMPSKKKRRRTEGDLDDEESPVAAPRSRKSTKKKAGRGKSSGTNWLLIGGLTGGGLVVVLFLAMLAASIGQARKAVANRAEQVAHWPTFRHPLGFAQVDMPGTPTLNAQQSLNGAQTYTLAQRNYQLSLIAIPLVGPSKMAIDSNPAAVDLMFNEMQTQTPKQIPGARLISANRITAGAVQGLEMKVDVKGNINLMRFYLFPDALVCAEFITRNETAYGADRERFLNSLRGPDGNVINAPNGAPTTGTASTAGAGVPGSPPRSLTEARRAVQTKLARRERSGKPVPDPPAAMARTVRYDAPSGKLAAYITTIPQDGRRHPAIVWISGGDCNTIDDGFFQESPPNNDQTASAFRKSGIVTMYPSLRGGNDNPGFKEGFLGEVDDVLAAADFLSKQDGIDPNRIYLGGHSTGGTLALLVAESTNRFRAIFSFGPTDDIRGYGDEFVFFDSRIPAEFEVRTPARWTEWIQNKTFVLEGMQQPGNVQSLQSMSRANRNPQVSFVAVRRANHFNILAPVTQLIATRILQDQGPTTGITLAESDLNLNYAR